jgi:hypothetical protein
MASAEVGLLNYGSFGLLMLPESLLHLLQLLLSLMSHNF